MTTRCLLAIAGVSTVLSVGCGMNPVPPTPLAPSAHLTCNGAAQSCDVSHGAGAVIAWTSDGAHSCSVTPPGWTGATGSEQLAGVTEAATYRLDCIGPGGAASSSVTLNVSRTRPASVTAEIRCNGLARQCSIANGAAATISWSSSDATACSVEPGGWTGSSGSRTTATLTSSVTYRVSCDHAGSTATDEVTVNVSPAAPTAPSSPPSASISCNGSTGSCAVASGTSARISWNGRGVTSCTVTPAGWTGTTGTQSTSALTSSATYEARCTGAGGSASAAVVVTVLPELPGGPGAPTIELTSVPPIGSTADLRGRVLHVRPSAHAVVVYIRVNNGWWVKPYFASPLTAISPVDGSWTADITTGGVDPQASEVVAFLVTSGFAPPLASGWTSLPLDVNGTTVLARVSRLR